VRETEKTRKICAIMLESSAFVGVGIGIGIGIENTGQRPTWLCLPDLILTTTPIPIPIPTPMISVSTDI